MSFWPFGDASPSSPIGAVSRCIIALILLPISTEAQSITKLPVGAEVRVSPHGEPFTSWTRGRVTRFTRDTLTISRPGGPVVFPLETVRRIDIRYGRVRSVTKTGILYTLTGAGMGAMYVPFVRGLLCHAFHPCKPLGTGRALLGVGAIAAMFGASGALVAHASNESRPWIETDIVNMAFVPLPIAGQARPVRLSVSLAF